MILADSSIWIDHFRKNNLVLESLLGSENIFTHPFIIGELSLGNFRNRKAVLQLLQCLPKVIIASDDEVFVFIEKYQLYGSGVGYIDAHLLASAFLSKTRLWTKDKKLKEVAIYLGCSYSGH